MQPDLDGFKMGHLITTTHGDICVQASKGVLVQHQDLVDLSVFLGHACISGTLLKPPGKLSSCHPCLMHSGHAQTQVELIALELVLDMFDYLPPGGIAMICPSSHINLCCPQHTACLKP